MPEPLPAFNDTIAELRSACEEYIAAIEALAEDESAAQGHLISEGIRIASRLETKAKDAVTLAIQFAALAKRNGVPGAPSIRELADLTNRSPNTVQDAIRRVTEGRTDKSKLLPF